MEQDPGEQQVSRPQSQGVIRPRQNPGPRIAFNSGRRPESKSIQGAQHKGAPTGGQRLGE